MVRESTDRMPPLALGTARSSAPTRGRIELDPDLPALSVPAPIWNELCAHARETFPEECCGLLSGSRLAPFATVHRCRNEMTRNHEADPVRYPRDGRTAFYMNEVDYLRAVEKAEGAGEAVTGVYHSHVGAGAYFSELDQAFVTQPLYPFPEAHHIVVSIVDGAVKDLASFRWEGDAGFTGRALRVQDGVGEEFAEASKPGRDHATGTGRGEQE